MAKRYSCSSVCRGASCCPPKPGTDEYTELYIDQDQLLDFNEYPNMSQNPYITKYYRPDLDARQSLASVLMIHNEFGNIWTHLVGAVLFIILFGYVTYEYSTSNTVSSRDIFAIQIQVFSSTVCFTLSSVYHAFNAHIERKKHRIFTLDYIGITTMMFGLDFAVIWIMLKDYIVATWVSIGISALLALVGYAFPFLVSNAIFENRNYRLGVYASIISLSVGVQLFAMSKYSFDYLKKNGLTYFILAMVSFAIAVFFYGSLIPERLSPGTFFDLWFNSHQLWHIFIVLSAWFHFLFIRQMSLAQAS